MDTAVDIAALAITTLLGIAGLYFGNALRLRMKQEVEERRLDAYLSLWPVLRVPAATRNEGAWAGGPLTEPERKALFDATTEWCYGKDETAKANGPFLTARARRVYFAAKRNLMCPVDEIQPGSNRERVKQSGNPNPARGAMSIRQFAIVRWVMRFDIQLHTEPYFQRLDRRDLDFLESCGVDWRKDPFRSWAEISIDAE
jgi:hypothetical protein